MASKVERRTVEDSRLQTRDQGEAAKPQVVGYAAVFNSQTVLYQSPTLVIRETIKPGAFKNAIAEGQDVRALIDHDSCQILGRTRAGTLELAEDGVGLFCLITPPDTQVARDVVENIRVGNLSQMSFAFVPRSSGETTTTTTVDGVVYQDIEITDVDLYDVSIVTYPAYADTSASLRAKQFVDEQRKSFITSRRARLDQLEAALAAKSK